MSSKKISIVLMAAVLTAWSVTPALAQYGIDPAGTSAHQMLGSEAPTSPSTSLASLTRSDFGLLGRAMLWTQLVWMPASPLQSVSAFAMVVPGDRRWGIR